MSAVYLDVKEWKSEQEAHRLIAQALCFPDYYGGNLDALYDCLSEQDRDVVLYNTALAPAGMDPEPFIRVFSDAGVLKKAVPSEEELTEEEKKEAGLTLKERTVIRPAGRKDFEFWQDLDPAVTREIYERKVRDSEALVLTLNGRRAAVLRYDLTGDGIPCCSLVRAKKSCRDRGLEERLLRRFEEEMGEKGMKYVLGLSRCASDLALLRGLGWRERGMLLPEDGEAREPVLILGKRI